MESSLVVSRSSLVNRIFGVCVTVLYLMSCTKCHETDLRNELVLSHKEKVAFDKFKSQVYSNITHDLMKTDLYLLRWLRGKKLNVKLATDDLFAFLEWRTEHNIDTIHKENWSDMIHEHPYQMDITDLQGRPVVVGSIGGRWNVRRSVRQQGRRQRIIRYTHKLVDEIFNRLYEVNRQHPNITQFSVIMNFDGFNVIQHACPMCITTYFQMLTLYNRFFPRFLHVVIVIKAPPTFAAVLDFFIPLLDKDTRELLQVYGYNQKKWKPMLDAEVSENLLTAEFGGTKPDNYDESDLW